MKKVKKSTLDKQTPPVAQALPIIDENLLQRKHVSEESYACAIRVLRFSWRQGTVSCKTRSDLAFSNRKPWKQKGTGRARVGSIRSPLWRKGAVLFGPQPRTRKLAIPRDQKKSLMNALFFNMYDKNAIACLDFPTTSGLVKTKQAWDILNRHNFIDRKVILFLATHDGQMQAAFRNIPSVHIIYYDQPNVYALSSGTHWLFLRKDAGLFTHMVEQWK